MLKLTKLLKILDYEKVQYIKKIKITENYKVNFIFVRIVFKKVVENAIFFSNVYKIFLFFLNLSTLGGINTFNLSYLESLIQ